MAPMLTTVNTAKILAFALGTIQPTTANQTTIDLASRPMPRLFQNATTRPSRSQLPMLGLVSPSTEIISAESLSYEKSGIETYRITTSSEKLIGELRGWTLFRANWDGEGAEAPSISSLRDAVTFVRLLDEKITLPEPMLLASGHAGLYWNESGLYADLEFFGNGRIAYYIELKSGKHKGVLNFSPNSMPKVLSALLET